VIGAFSSFFVHRLKAESDVFLRNDPLRIFAVHAGGGLVGMFFTGIFAEYGPRLSIRGNRRRGADARAARQPSDSMATPRFQSRSTPWVNELGRASKPLSLAPFTLTLPVANLPMPSRVWRTPS